MSAVPARIGIMAARQGGFSVVQLPRPLEVQWDGSFVFLPTKTGDTWQVIGGGDVYGLTLYEAVEDDSRSLATSGGPYSGAEVLLIDNASSEPPWFHFAATNSAFAPSTDTEGITFEMYADFGPDGNSPPEEGRIHSSTIIAYLTVSEGADQSGYIERPYVYSQVDGQTTRPQSISGFPGDSGLYAGVQWLISNSEQGGSGGPLVGGYGTTPSVVDDIGWQHIAGELYADGKVRIYWNGVLAIDATVPAPPAGFLQSLDTFVPCWCFFNQNGAGGRPYTKVHGVRYSPFIRYYGGNFTPPLL